MPSMSRSRRLAFVALFVVLIAASGERILDRVTETPVERAYRECRLCRLGDDEIAAMIGNVRQRGLTRREEPQPFEPTNPEACERCGRG